MDNISYIPNKQMTVLWSGGTDSTLLLFEAAMKAKEYSKDVYALVIKSDNIDEEKEKLEKQSRQLILEEFKKRGLNNIKVVQAKIDVWANKWARHTHAQDFMWTITTHMAIEDSIVYYAYIKDDDYDIEGLHRSMTLFNAMSTHCATMNELQFPYQHRTKKYIIENLIKYGLYDKVWFCQNPIDGKCCNGCTSCILHNDTLIKMGLKDSDEKLSDYFHKIRVPFEANENTLEFMKNKSISNIKKNTKLNKFKSMVTYYTLKATVNYYISSLNMSDKTELKALYDAMNITTDGVTRKFITEELNKRLDEIKDIIKTKYIYKSVRKYKDIEDLIKGAILMDDYEQVNFLSETLVYILSNGDK